MSVALLKMIRRTTAGVGLWPPCDWRKAWMTSAATPEVSGVDSLVPPKVLEADRAAADRVRTVGVGHGVRRAVGPVQIAGGDDVRRPPLFGHARAGQRRDLVVEPAGRALSEPVRGRAAAVVDHLGQVVQEEVRLGEDPVRGARRHADHAGVERRAPLRVRRAGVAGAGDDDDAVGHRVLEDRGQRLPGRGVRERGRPEGHREDVDVVLLDGPVDSLQDLAREADVAGAEDLHHVDVGPGRHAEHLDVARAAGWWRSPG